MNKLTHEKRCAVVRCLVDGCSVLLVSRVWKIEDMVDLIDTPMFRQKVS
jgi:hypothetical protein